MKMQSRVEFLGWNKFDWKDKEDGSGRSALVLYVIPPVNGTLEGRKPEAVQVPKDKIARVLEALPSLPAGQLLDISCEVRAGKNSQLFVNLDSFEVVTGQGRHRS